MAHVTVVAHITVVAVVVGVRFAVSVTKKIVNGQQTTSKVTKTEELYSFKKMFARPNVADVCTCKIKFMNWKTLTMVENG